MTAVVAETDQGKAAKEPPAKPGKEETGNGTKPTPEVMWAWEQGLPRPEQLPGTNSQLLTPSLANAFGIQMMNGYRYPLPPPSQESGERANGESRAPGSYHDPMGAAQMQASMPPPYGNFHHSMPPPGSANAQAAAAAAMASAAMASYGGFPGMYQAPFGAQRPGGHYDHYGRPLSQGGDRGMGPSQGHMDPNVSYEHMMAYQAGMEHSRSFDAFKRSREDPGMSMGMEGTEDDAAHALKRPRLVWTPPLHKRFVDAVSHLGIKNAVPKTIMQLMNVEGLTRENVASHLQKYRLYLKRLQGCSESTMENSPSREIQSEIEQEDKEILSSLKTTSAVQVTQSTSQEVKPSPRTSALMGVPKVPMPQPRVSNIPPTSSLAGFPLDTFRITPLNKHFFHVDDKILKF